jgi:hypothetical protein
MSDQPKTEEQPELPKRTLEERLAFLETFLVTREVTTQLAMQVQQRGTNVSTQMMLQHMAMSGEILGQLHELCVYVGAVQSSVPEQQVFCNLLMQFMNSLEESAKAVHRRMQLMVESNGGLPKEPAPGLVGADGKPLSQ